MENKQTAVEWLQKIFKEREPDKFDWEQAKQMEKEQIKDAHLLGLIHSLEREATKQAEQYYNETFKSENNKSK